MKFNEKLLYARAKLNLSQNDLAKLLHVSYVTVCRWECQKTKATKKAMYALDQLLKDNHIEIEDEIDEKI